MKKGIYFEKTRQRYRVRIYKYGRMVHRSYHVTLSEAETALNEAEAERQTIQKPKRKKDKPLTTQNMLKQLNT